MKLFLYISLCLISNNLYANNTLLSVLENDIINSRNYVSNVIVDFSKDIDYKLSNQKTSLKNTP